MEVWKEIPGYSGLYEVSDQGRVRSFARDPSGAIMRPSPNSRGYPTVSLTNTEGRKSFKVHRLILLAFVGPSNLPVNHKNSIKADNRLDNLEYVTQRENQRHFYASKKDRRFPPGVSFHELAKLYEAKITVNGKCQRLGRFKTPEEAHEAYRARSIELNDKKYINPSEVGAYQ